MIFHENRLPADDSHEISCFFVIFEKETKLLQIIGGALRVNIVCFIYWYIGPFREKLLFCFMRTTKANTSLILFAV